MAEPWSFGAWLKQRRGALDLTQAELARRLGCATVTLQKWELDERRPSKGLAALLAEHLQLPPDQRTTFVLAARGVVGAERLPGNALPGSALPAFAAMRTDVPRRANLPTPLGPLIGRSQELGALSALLLHDDVRLMTLTGPGGTGKTRLAVAIAARLERDFPDGIHFVALGSLADPVLVPSTVAAALGVSVRERDSLDERLIAYLGGKRALLVLDNVEHLLSAGAWISELLHHCPLLTVLLTSRTVLHLSAEQVFPVPPLALPDLVGPRGQRLEPALDDLRHCEAVQLFEQRARAVSPDFVLGDHDVPVVAEICRQLDGLPLAIELAAARSRLLSPTALLGRLDHRLALLTGGARDAPARQRTLRATLDWSYALLSANEQRVFARCAVFAGGFWLASAEAVCAEPDLSAPVLDLLQALVEHGLVQTTQVAVRTPAALPDLGPRFVLLETIREYALERLALSGALDELKERHATYLCQFAETVEPELLGTDDIAWLVWLNTERDNFRAALQWSADAPAGAERSLRLATALWRFWDLWDRREGHGWLERELERERPVPPAARAKAQGRAAEFAARQGDLTLASLRAEASLHGCRAMDDRRGSAFALYVLGLVAQYQGDEAHAELLWTESLDLFRGVGDRWGQGIALLWLANMAVSRHAYRRAELCLAQARDHFEQAGDTPALAWTLGGLGRTAGVQGDHAQAAVWYRQAVQRFLHLTELRSSHRSFRAAGMFARLVGETAQARELLAVALRLAQEYGDTIETANALRELARMAEDQGDTADAINLWQQCLNWSRHASDPFDVLDALIGLGTNANLQGQVVQAQASFTEALASMRNEPRASFAAVRCVLGLAVAARGTERLERSARLGGAADAATARGGWRNNIREMDGRPLHDHTLMRLRLEIADVGLGPLWEAGAALTLEQAMADALEQDPSLPDSISMGSTAGEADRASTTGLGTLTRREREVLRLVAQGLRTAEVAAELGLSPQTVSVHLRATYRKLGVRSRTAATRVAIDQHVV